MRFKGMTLLAAAGALAMMAGSAQAATQIVNISALGSGGTTVALAAGNYKASFIGTAQGGAYSAWNPWSAVSGCNPSGGNCSTGWLLSLGIDLGYGTSTFNHTDGWQYGQKAPPGDSLIFATPELALASFNPVNLIRAALPQASDPSAYSPVNYPIGFSLAGAQSVNFFILDYPYGDNSGGVSILLDDGIAAGVPEPASWAMLIGGMAVVGFAMRRRARRTISFA